MPSGITVPHSSTSIPLIGVSGGTTRLGGLGSGGTNSTVGISASLGFFGGGVSNRLSVLSIFSNLALIRFFSLGFFS